MSIPPKPLLTPTRDATADPRSYADISLDELLGEEITTESGMSDYMSLSVTSEDGSSMGIKNSEDSTTTSESDSDSYDQHGKPPQFYLKRTPSELEIVRRKHEELLRRQSMEATYKDPSSDNITDS